MAAGPLIARNWCPSGNFQTRILSLPPDAKVYSLGCSTIALTPFLCCVKVWRHSCLRISQNLIILSWEPVIICGSSAWQRIDSTVFECPLKQATCIFVRKSQTRAVASLPPVTSKSSSGWSAQLKTPERCPWYYLTTLFCSRSQHLTYLSSPTENIYGCLSERHKARTVFMWPVKVTLHWPVTRSQSLIVLSALPDAKNSFLGSIAKHLTHPWWPLITVLSSQGACHSGSTIFLDFKVIAFLLLYRARSKLSCYWGLVFAIAFYVYSDCSAITGSLPYYVG